MIKKNENPAVKLVKTFQEISKGCNSKEGLQGIILAPPPEIRIAYNNIILDKDDVWINENLLIGYTRTAQGHIVSETQPRGGGGGYAQYESHTHDIDNDYTDSITYTDTLKPGDHVALIKIEGTGQYFVMFKAVRL